MSLTLKVGDVVRVALDFRREGYYKVRMTGFDVVTAVYGLNLDGPYFDLECTRRDYNDASTAPKFHPDSFARKDSDKDAT